MSNPLLISIECGNKYTKCFYYDHQNATFHPYIFSGKETLPTCVDFTRDPPIVGMETPRLDCVNDIMTFLGKKFEDVEDKVARSQSEIVADEDGYCKYVIPINDNEVHMSPRQILSLVLQHVKKEVLRYHNLPETHPVSVVLPVPGNFLDSQIKELVAAVEQAGMNVLTIINESSAVLYAHKEENIEEGYHFIVNLDHNNFDISVCEKRDKQILTKYKVGNSQLGLVDFINNCKEAIVEQLDNPDFFRLTVHDTRALRMEKRKRNFILIQLIEKAIIELLKKEKSLIQLSQVNIEQEIEITRDLFDEWNDNLYQQFDDIIEKCISECAITKQKLKSITFVGVSEMPFIVKLMTTRFPDARINHEIDSNKVIGIGALKFAMMKKDFFESK